MSKLNAVSKLAPIELENRIYSLISKNKNPFVKSIASVGDSMRIVTSQEVFDWWKTKSKDQRKKILSKNFSNISDWNSQYDDMVKDYLSSFIQPHAIVFVKTSNARKHDLERANIFQLDLDKSGKIIDVLPLASFGSPDQKDSMSSLLEECYAEIGVDID